VKWEGSIHGAHAQVSGEVVALFDDQAAQRPRCVRVRREPAVDPVERISRGKEPDHDAAGDLDAALIPHRAQRREILVVVARCQITALPGPESLDDGIEMIIGQAGIAQR